MIVLERTSLRDEDIQALTGNPAVVETPPRYVSVPLPHDEPAETEVSSTEEIETSGEPVESISNIPENPKSSQRDDVGIRFSSAHWAEEVKCINIDVIGVGGIGSWTTMLLSRLNPFSIKVTDNDNYDYSNISGQCVRVADIGVPKVISIRNLCATFSNYYRVSAFHERFTAESILSNNDVTICGLDNMTSRKDVFKNWKINISSHARRHGRPCLFIDGRLTAEELQVYCFTSTDTALIRKYETEALFSDKEALPAVCSYKQTSHIAAMIGSIITNLVTNYVVKTSYPNDSPEYLQRALPYFTTYDAVNMRFETKML